MLILFTLAIAQEQPQEEAQEEAPPVVQYKAVTTLDWDHEVRVEGTVERPTGSWVFQRQGGTFNPLIRLRQNFEDELTASVELVK